MELYLLRACWGRAVLGREQLPPPLQATTLAERYLLALRWLNVTASWNAVRKACSTPSPVAADTVMCTPPCSAAHADASDEDTSCGLSHCEKVRVADRWAHCWCS